MLSKKKKPTRKIAIVGGIDSEALGTFLEALGELEAASDDPIELEICSEGGEATTALAFAGRINKSSCTINATAYGLVASAATLILAACNHRRMEASAWVMVHEELGEISFQSVKHLEKIGAQMRKMETQWSGLMAYYTGTPVEKWTELHQRETFLTAAECQSLGLVHEVV